MRTISAMKPIERGVVQVGGIKRQAPWSFCVRIGDETIPNRNMSSAPGENHIAGPALSVTLFDGPLHGFRIIPGGKALASLFHCQEGRRHADALLVLNQPRGGRRQLFRCDHEESNRLGLGNIPLGISVPRHSRHGESDQETAQSDSRFVQTKKAHTHDTSRSMPWEPLEN